LGLANDEAASPIAGSAANASLLNSRLVLIIDGSPQNDG
jgi:hypothetical protein